MAIEDLAEAVIFQSLEDFWAKGRRKESIDFFTGDGFRVFADIAGMKVVDRLALLKLMRSSTSGGLPSRHAITLRRARAVI